MLLYFTTPEYFRIYGYKYRLLQMRLSNALNLLRGVYQTTAPVLSFNFLL
jgi:hypothetical protein